MANNRFYVGDGKPIVLTHRTALGQIIPVDSVDFAETNIYFRALSGNQTIFVRPLEYPDGSLGTDGRLQYKIKTNDDFVRAAKFSVWSKLYFDADNVFHTDAIVVEFKNPGEQY